MEAVFEAKYISIKWYDKNTILKIDEAILPISIEVENSNTYHIELQAYKRIENGLDGQVAFHLLNDSSIKPYFLNASGDKVLLMKITDPKTDKIWWIEKGKWKGKYRESLLWNHIGETKIKFNDIICHINVRANSFTKEELDLYLQDFRNDFWYLILQNDSLTQDDAKNKKVKILDNKSIKLISEFIDYVEKVLLNPKKELREIQSLKDIKKVKPVARTFMEIATSGFKKKLTSRDTVESYNVSENRYIHYAVQQVYTIVFHILNATEHIDELYANKVKSDKERLDSFSDIKVIDKEAFENDVEELQIETTNELLSLYNCIRKQNRPIDTSVYKKEKVIVQLGNRTNNKYKFEFFGNMKNTINDPWLNFKDMKFKNTKYEGSFFMISFDSNFFYDELKSGYEYEITGYIKSYDKERSPQKGFKYKREFLFITNIKILKSKIEEKLKYLKNQKSNLELSNWQRKLTPRELKEQKYDKEVLRNNLDNLKNEQKNNLQLIKALEPSLNKLKKLLLRFKKLKIKQDSYFSNSMTFIQNPNYQGSHSIFKKIKNLIGIDEKLFLQMQLVEKIGLKDIPTIYERWCFLQIIKILIEKYHFLPEENWKSKLSHQAMGNLNNIKNIKISFTNNKIARDIDLWYEKELENKKRPDFVLDIKSKFGTNKTHRLVMDAKFHEKVDIEGQIDLLYYQKNYSENNKNTVFILHPDANKSVKKKRTPKEWGNDAYYGEVEMFNFEWDKDNKPNHKYGAILLSPIGKRGNFLDNLQRLIGMVMQYNMENNEDCNDPKPKEKVFCLICGSDKQHLGDRESTKNKRGYKYEITCQECQHRYIYNYCWNCKHRLIKNGYYWSYHSSEILQPFNIRCPHCNEIYYNHKEE